METLRDEVKFALMVQPGREHPALDGDGHAIVPSTFFEGRVPERWLSEDVFRNPRCYEACGYDGEDVHGVATLNVHNWVAHRVAMADPTFECPGFHGRGTQARAILDSLHAWVGRGVSR
jgi:hypothetical protein